jgi:3-deoxy-D-manno-octulosonic-acid transferase
MRMLYSLILHLLAPLVLANLLWRSLRMPAYRRRIGERFGFVDVATTPIEVWVHAVSVGETLAALPLIRGLVARYGPGRVLVTTTTPTGSVRVRDALGDAVRHVYAPYDLPHAVDRFLRRIQPRRVVVMENELWPNLFHALARRGVPLLLANARLSPRSFRGYRRLRNFARNTLADCAGIAAQSPADAERFVSLGAPTGRISVIGNLKFDQDVGADQVAAGRALRAQLGAGRPVWIAASTHDREEPMVLAAHRQLRRVLPQAVLVIVPRQPQRFDAVARQIVAQGWTLARRSGPADDLATAQILLGDSMGEMFAYLAAGDLAFVGGSLVEAGGHNVLEPAALGLPVLFGPSMHNFTMARALLLDAGAAREVSAADLASTLTVLLQSPAQRRAMGDAGRAVIDANRGATERLLVAIQSLPAAD